MPAGRGVEILLATLSASAVNAAPVWLLNGLALWAMSSRNAWLVRTTLAGTSTPSPPFAAGLPSIGLLMSAVTICGNPFSPGMNLPYWSVISSGRLTTSLSRSWIPSKSAAWALTSAQVGNPPSAPSSIRPVATGSPFAFSSYSRRNTWCDACEV
ncbi:hypothetical protein D9M70_353090 [compost metagenome]